MAKKELEDLRKEVTKQGPSMDYSKESGIAFPKPSGKRRKKKGWGKK